MTRARLSPAPKSSLESLIRRYRPGKRQVQHWTDIRKERYKLVWNDRNVNGIETRTFRLFNVQEDPQNDTI
jgi:hypothetical protein